MTQLEKVNSYSCVNIIWWALLQHSHLGLQSLTVSEILVNVNTRIGVIVSLSVNRINSTESFPVQQPSNKLKTYDMKSLTTVAT